MKPFIKNIQRDTNKWSILLLTIVLFVALPTFIIFINLFKGPGVSWEHISKVLLPDYVQNSLILIVGTSFFTLFFGISSGWLLTRYHLPFSKQLSWLLILPLAIPSYITAYAYAGVFDYGGFFDEYFHYKIDIMNQYGLILVLSVSLYPYIYVASRAFFLNQSNNIIEASKLLGASESRTFYKLMLPLARPAYIGGLILVLMEVLNDYGAAKYYGVSTFTTGVFRAWFSLEEPETAIYLSAILVGIIFLLISIEKWQRRKIGYFNSAKSHQQIKKIEPSKKQGILIFIIVFVPVFLGFIVPIIQLLHWAILTYKEVLDFKFLSIAFQSLSIALLTSFGTVLIVLFLIFFTKWNQLNILKPLTKITILGYAIPGAVIAIGVLIPTLFIDKWLIDFFEINLDIKIGFLINGSIIALIYAYMIRYMAVAYNPIEASSLKIGKSLAEASRMLGKNNLYTFFKIELPLLKSAILSGFILVFVDVIKELPLTLILKPYHINTLAVKAYEYASDEMIAEAALPSLFIVLTGVIPVVFLNRLISKN